MELSQLLIFIILRILCISIIILVFEVQCIDTGCHDTKCKSFDVKKNLKFAFQGIAWNRFIAGNICNSVGALQYDKNSDPLGTFPKCAGRIDSGAIWDYDKRTLYTSKTVKIGQRLSCCARYSQQTSDDDTWACATISRLWRKSKQEYVPPGSELPISFTHEDIGVKTNLGTAKITPYENFESGDYLYCFSNGFQVVKVE